MAHYAWIDSNNIVVNVTVGVDENITQQGVGGSTEAWETFYTDAVNQEGVYLKRTSYNGNIHKNYAGIGYTFDGIGFAAPQPFPSWTKNAATYLWEAPVAYPADDKRYAWDEDTTSWIEQPTE